MKKIHIIFIISILISSCTKEKYYDTVVVGEIINVDSGQVFSTSPSNGFSYIGFRDTIQLDSTGIFKINCKIKEPGLIQFYYKKLYTFYVNPGDSIKVKIMPSGLEVSGDNGTGNKFLNTLNRPFYAQTDAIQFFGDTLMSSLLPKIDGRNNKEIIHLDSLNGIEQINKDFYSFINEDINTYYSNLLSEIASLYYFKSFREKSGEIRIPSSIDSLWKSLYETKDISFTSSVYSNWWYDYTLNYLLNFIDYTNDEGNSDIQHLKVLERAMKRLDANDLEVFLARYIHIFARQNKLEKELITMYQEFKTRFPKSPFINFLTPEINKITTFYENLSNKDPEIIMIPGYEGINTLTDIKDQFTDNIIYIDIWATWCGSCLEEFGHYTTILEKYENSNIKFVFLSIDRSNMKEKWLDVIEGYELKGYHILANAQLQSHLHNLFNNSEGEYFIPRYVLIGSDGKIISDSAKRPSDGKELFDQLDSALSDL